MNATLDRTSINKLLSKGHSKVKLAESFAISRQALLRYLEGDEPFHPGITLYINYHAKKLLQQ